MDRISFHEQISRNKIKSFLLLASILIVLILLGFFIGKVVGPDYFFIIMIISIIFSVFYIWFGYYNSHKIALASVNAKPASYSEYPMYNQVIESLCIASGIPKPKLYVMHENHINAFASGRDPENAVICVTTGCLEKLDKHELEGVLAHELSHVANYDIRFMTLTAVLVGMITIISEIFLRSIFWKSLDNDNKKNQSIIIIIGIILAIIAPIITSLVQLSISRKREYTADASAVKFIRSPTGLKNALKKIQKEHPLKNSEEKHHYNKALAPLFISDPFKRKISELFATHPSIEKRIEILEKM
ncbi:MAG: M48 family metallopeptidase [Nanoarchaeota archaeon]